MSKDLIKGSFYVSLSNIIFNLGNFLFWIIFGKLLKVYEIGYATASFSIAYTLSSLANLGLTYAILRELQLRKEVLMNTLILGILISTIIGFGSFFFKDIFPSFKSFTTLSFLLTILSLTSTILTNSLIAILKFREYFLINLILIISKIAFGLILIPLSSYGIILAIVISTFITIPISLYYLKEYLTPKINLSEIKEILKIGISNYPLSISSPFFLISLSTILTATLTSNPEITGLLYFAFMFLLVITIIPNAFNTVSLPLAVKSDKEITKEAIRIGMGFSLPLIMLAIAYGNFFLWLINTEMVKAYQTFLILSISTVSESFIQNAISRLNAEKRLRDLILLGILRIFSFLSLILFLNHNLFEISLAFVISSIITSIFAVYLVKIFGLFLKSYLAFIISYMSILINPLFFLISIPLVFLLKIIRKEDIRLINLFRIW